MLHPVLVLAFLGLSAFAKEGPCHQARKDIHAGPGGRMMLGAYIPQCTDEGVFHEIQCHGSTGMCWCVDPLTGVSVSEQKRGVPDCGAEVSSPSCETQSSEADCAAVSQCTWCKSAAVPSKCYTKDDAKKLPSAVFQCSSNEPAAPLLNLMPGPVLFPSAPSPQTTPPVSHGRVGHHMSQMPKWLMNPSLEQPKGVRDMGTWKRKVFTDEQQKRLGIDEDGKPVAPAEPVPVSQPVASEGADADKSRLAKGTLSGFARSFFNMADKKPTTVTVVRTLPFGLGRIMRMMNEVHLRLRSVRAHDPAGEKHTARAEPNSNEDGKSVLARLIRVGLRGVFHQDGAEKDAGGEWHKHGHKWHRHKNGNKPHTHGDSEDSVKKGAGGEWHKHGHKWHKHKNGNQPHSHGEFEDSVEKGAGGEWHKHGHKWHKHKNGNQPHNHGDSEDSVEKGADGEWHKHGHKWHKHKNGNQPHEHSQHHGGHHKHHHGHHDGDDHAPHHGHHGHGEGHHPEEEHGHHHGHHEHHHHGHHDEDEHGPHHGHHGHGEGHHHGHGEGHHHGHQGSHPEEEEHHHKKGGFIRRVTDWFRGMFGRHHKGDRHHRDDGNHGSDHDSSKTHLHSHEEQVHEL